MDYVQYLLLLAYTQIFKQLQVIILSTLSPSVPSSTPNARRSLRALGFHPTLLKAAGIHRFLPSSRYRRFPFTLETSIVQPFPLGSFRLSGGPPYGTMASADFLQFSYTLLHRFSFGGTVCQSPYKVFARPPRVRASNLRPMQPPHLHHRVRVVSDFAL
jgi:hypothetical protein